MPNGYLLRFSDYVGIWDDLEGLKRLLAGLKPGYYHFSLWPVAPLHKEGDDLGDRPVQQGRIDAMNAFSPNLNWGTAPRRGRYAPEVRAFKV